MSWQIETAPLFLSDDYHISIVHESFLRVFDERKKRASCQKFSNWDGKLMSKPWSFSNTANLKKSSLEIVITMDRRTLGITSSQAMMPRSGSFLSNQIWTLNIKSITRNEHIRQTPIIGKLTKYRKILRLNTGASFGSSFPVVGLSSSTPRQSGRGDSVQSGGTQKAPHWFESSTVQRRQASKYKDAQATMNNEKMTWPTSCAVCKKWETKAVKTETHLNIKNHFPDSARTAQPTAMSRKLRERQVPACSVRAKQSTRQLWRQSKMQSHLMGMIRKVI